MEINIEFSDLKQATEFSNILKEKNLRGVKVSQKRKEQKEGVLGIEEYLPELLLFVKPEFFTTIITKVFDLIVELYKIKSKEKIEEGKREDKRNHIKFSIEIEGKKYSYEGNIKNFDKENALSVFIEK